MAPIPVLPGFAIPQSSFKSWSLFLSCNPAWLLPEKATALRDLYAWFDAFGTATGPRHATLWFGNSDTTDAPFSGLTAKSIDVARSVEYCRRFNLASSEGPFVVVTTVYPDAWASGDSTVVLAFENRSATDIGKMFGKLIDQVVTEKLSQQAIDSEAWWRSWIRVVESGCKWMGKVKFKVSAKVVEVERTGLCGDSGS